MERTKSLTAPIPESLHARVTAERIAANQSLGEYMTELLIAYYNNGGNKTMAQTRTLAFQIDEELFQRIKAHLARESARTGKKLTQRDILQDGGQRDKQQARPGAHIQPVGKTGGDESAAATLNPADPRAR